MTYDSAKEALLALIHAYYVEHSADHSLACVTEDIQWIGTEADDTAVGKKALKTLLETDFDRFPSFLNVKIDDVRAYPMGEHVAGMVVSARQEEVPGVVCAFPIRGTAACVHTEGGWLVSMVHISVPNTEIEKYTLTRDLDDRRKKEQLLLAGIPGGVATYRLKKNGTIYTDYASDGVAHMCGYENTNDFLAYLRPDAAINIAREDLPALQRAIANAMATHKPLSIMYRIHVRNREDILQRLDANVIDADLGRDDLAVWYAVHTTVSDESKRILDSQKMLQALIDQVPTGIGIFEVKGETIAQLFMNQAFYRMLGVNREDRSRYFGENALLCVHPDDEETVRSAVQRLVNGDNAAALTYRIKDETGQWFWLRLTAAVVERREGCLKVYAALSDHNEIVKTQTELEAAQTTMDTALHAADTLTWKYNCHTRQITDSMTLGEAFGLPKVIDDASETLIRMGYFAEESIEPFRRLFDRVAEEKTASEEVKAIVDDQGSLAWYKLIYTPTFDSKGNYLDTVGIGINISEQKAKEQEYEEQLRMTQVLSEKSFARMIYNLTKNTVITYNGNDGQVNELLSRLSADEMIAMLRDVVPEADLEQLQHIQSCASLMKEYQNGNRHFEYRHRLKNQEGKWFKSVFELVQNPYTGDIESVSLVTDITDEVQAELMMDTLIDVDYQSIMLIDVKTGWLTPFTRKAVSAELADFLKLQSATNSAAQGLEAFFRAYAEPSSVEEAVRENSVRTICEHLTERPFYETTYKLVEAGKALYHRALYAYLDDSRTKLIAAVQDMTETYRHDEKQRARLAAALEKSKAANIAKTAFLSRISHDMRTPLNGILGLTAILKEKITDEHILLDLRELEYSGQYLLNLINDTLDVSRIESGKLELHPQVCEGRDLFNTALQLMKTRIDQKKIQLRIHAPNIPFTMLYVDAARIQQIVMNILGNAVKFTPEGGTISVKMENLSYENGIITDKLTISDTGIGMSKEFLPHLFESFSQEDNTNTSRTEGTGLGMAITKQLLTLMDSEISVESEKGKGTVFTILLRLPVATEEQIAAWKKKRLPQNRTMDLSGRRILLCEDHPVNAKISIRLLTKRGMLVDHAENGRIGVDMFSHSADGFYDAILMDVRMPVLDGITAAREIRALNRKDASEVPIIAVTANAFQDDMALTKKAGMNVHLSKPIDPEQLYQTLEQLLHINITARKKKILLVDDVETNRAVLRAALCDAYDILEAENGKAALAVMAGTSGIDAVITDIQMPVMDGMELIRCIRSNPEFRHIVIIANTQFGAPEQEETLLALGANDFVYKPTTPKIVQMRVKNSLRNYT